jgi:hypothetical protein
MRSEQAYKLLQTLTTKDAPKGEEFDTWVLRCIQALSDKVGVLELELSKLRIKNEDRKSKT